MSLREMLSDYWYAFQQELFPRLESELGPMGERYELVAVLELVRVEALLSYFRGQVGRPEEDRAALARAFIAKAVFDVPTTRGLIERLEVDGRLWRLCGWSGAGRLPSEATFSRAFSEFAESGLASRLHETLIARTMDGHLVEHISRDATAIEAREKAAPKPKAAKPKRRRKRGRPRKGEARAKEPSRLERQLTMSLPQMLADLPRACDVGAKRNAKGHTTSWIGYKLHVDTADGGIPISCIMTSASTHDSQVAIPLGTLTAGRVENLYDLMDAAYDSIEIWAHCILLGHKPIIDVNPRRSVDMKEALKREKKARRTLGLVFPEERRYVERSGSERVNGRLKDEFGGRHVRVRGYDPRPPHVWHDRSDGQPADAPYRSADLVRLVSFAITVAALLERRCGQTRLKFGENTESEAAPTLIRPWSRSKSRQLPCADVAASLGVLAPLRIDQNFASGSVFLLIRDAHPAMSVG